MNGSSSGDCSPLIAAIRARRSVRSYLPEALSEDTLRKLNATLSELAGIYPDITLSLENNGLGEEKLGTYGIIKNAPVFIAIMCANTKEALLGGGSAAEKAVIIATALGLGTCWLGGSFDRKRFTRRLKIPEHFVIPAVISAGLPAEKPKLLDGLMRKAAGSDNRKPNAELFFDLDFGNALALSERKDIADALEMVRLAPSASNKQPWRAVCQKDSLDFYLAHAQGYEKMSVDMQMLDMGIAMSHFELVMREKQLPGKWKNLVPDIIAPHRTEYITSWVF